MQQLGSCLFSKVSYYILWLCKFKPFACRRFPLESILGNQIFEKIPKFNHQKKKIEFELQIISCLGVPLSSSFCFAEDFLCGCIGREILVIIPILLCVVIHSKKDLEFFVLLFKCFFVFICLAAGNIFI